MYVDIPIPGFGLGTTAFVVVIMIIFWVVVRFIPGE